MQASDHTLLAALLSAQDRDNAVAAYPQIETYAHQIIDWASHFEQPLLIPVGDTAHRLLGAASLLAHGTLDVPVWSDRLHGRNVLLVGTVTASLIEFDMAAANARSRGANTVHGCAIEIGTPPEAHTLDSITLLDRPRPAARRSA